MNHQRLTKAALITELQATTHQAHQLEQERTAALVVALVSIVLALLF